MASPGKVTLFVLPGSHPSRTAQLMLEQKGLEYKRVDLIPAIHKLVLRAMGFPGATVPAMKVDGRKVQGSREISRELDRLAPEPPLFPAEPEAQAQVAEAERWGDEELQPVPRRLLWWCLKHDRSPLESFSTGARLGIPTGLALKTAGPIVALAVRYNDATDANARRDLAELPAILDRIDGWIADGVLGGEQPNAADCQIATSLRLLMTLEDLRPAIEARPCGELAMRMVPEYHGRVPAGALPAEWLAPFQAAPQAA